MYMRIYARIGKNRLLSILLSRKEYGMCEKQIEQKLVQEVRKCGGICPKFTSPGFAGMPGQTVAPASWQNGFCRIESAWTQAKAAPGGKA